MNHPHTPPKKHNPIQTSPFNKRQQNQKYNKISNILPQQSKQQIQIFPKDRLIFVCSSHRTSAHLKIVIPPKCQTKVYRYNIKTTSKEDYKVTQPTGLLKKRTSEHIITIYIKKQTQLFTRNLRDRFMITIIEEQSQKIVLKQQLGILIQSGLQDNSTIHTNDYQSANVSRLASVYFNSAERVSINNGNQSLERIREHLSAVMNKDNDYSKKPQDSLKNKLNDTIQEIEIKKRRILLLDRENANNNAQGRFRLYLLLIIMLIAFLGGLYAKKINLFGIIESIILKLLAYIQRIFHRIHISIDSY